MRDAAFTFYLLLFTGPNLFNTLDQLKNVYWFLHIFPVKCWNLFSNIIQMSCQTMTSKRIKPDTSDAYVALVLITAIFFRANSCYSFFWRKVTGFKILSLLYWNAAWGRKVMLFQSISVLLCIEVVWIYLAGTECHCTASFLFSNTSEAFLWGKAKIHLCDV